MDTLNSKDPSEITCGINIYSGLPGPVKPLDSETFGEIIKLWESFPPAERGDNPPPLGYRGCWIRKGSGEWLAYKGTITYSEHEAVQEIRRDEEELIENRIKALFGIEL